VVTINSSQTSPHNCWDKFTSRDYGCLAAINGGLSKFIVVSISREKLSFAHWPQFLSSCVATSKSCKSSHCGYQFLHTCDSGRKVTCETIRPRRMQGSSCFNQWPKPTKNSKELLTRSWAEPLRALRRYWVDFILLRGAPCKVWPRDGYTSPTAVQSHKKKLAEVRAAQSDPTENERSRTYILPVLHCLYDPVYKKISIDIARYPGAMERYLPFVVWKTYRFWHVLQVSEDKASSGTQLFYWQLISLDALRRWSNSLIASPWVSFG